jgi:hypothetical protein
MRTRYIATLLATVAALLCNAPAASAYPYWQTFTVNSNWHCGETREIQSSVFVETCVVVNRFGGAQAVVKIGNYSGRAITIEAPVVKLIIYDFVAENSACLDSTLNSGFVRACLGHTGQWACRPARAMAEVLINGREEWTPESPTTTTAC